MYIERKYQIQHKAFTIQSRNFMRLRIRNHHILNINTCVCVFNSKAQCVLRRCLMIVIKILRNRTVAGKNCNPTQCLSNAENYSGFEAHRTNKRFAITAVIINKMLWDP